MNFSEMKKIMDAKNFVFEPAVMAQTNYHMVDKDCEDSAINYLTQLFDMGGMYQKLYLLSLKEIQDLKDSVEYFQKENGKLQETINFNNGNDQLH